MRFKPHPLYRVEGADLHMDLPIAPWEAALGGTACMIAQLIVDAMIARVRARIPGPVDALAATDPLRVAFGQLHLLSVVLLGIAMLSAFAILIIAVRGLRTSS